MLNSRNERELAYLVKVDSITEMNADRLECAHIGGWNCVVGKGEFHEGDLAVYIESDAQVPEVAPFSEMEFLRSKHFKIKPQKIRGIVSHGLLVSIQTLGWTEAWCADGRYAVCDKDGNSYYLDDDSRFLTQVLGITYAVSEDNARKASTGDKYKKMAQRHPAAAKTKIWRWLWGRKWGKKLLFLFFGRKKDKKSAWPSWVVKTDEDRIQNLPYLLADKNTKWIVTEKIDGTSTTFTMKRRGRKYDFYVCSRNVVFDKPDKKCFYDTNVYLEMAEKYHMEEVMNSILKQMPELNYVTIQGETYGGNIQKRNYGDEHRLAIFNVIFGYKNGEVTRLNPVAMAKFLDEYELPYVPIVEEYFVLPDTCDEMIAYAHGASAVDGGWREGVVCRSSDGVRSFKAVDDQYLLKFHQ